jgi:hypothetical protein
MVRPKAVVPGREVMGQQLPSTFAQQDRQDAVQDFALQLLLQPLGLAWGTRCLIDSHIFITEVDWLRGSGFHMVRW